MAKGKTYIDAEGNCWFFIPNFGRIKFTDADDLRERLRGYGFQRPQDILKDIEFAQEIPGDDIDAEEADPVEEVIEEVEEIAEDLLGDDGEE